MADNLDHSNHKDHPETPEDLQWLRATTETTSFTRRLLEQMVSTLLIASIIGLVGLGYTAGFTILAHTAAIEAIEGHKRRIETTVARLSLQMREVELFMASGDRWTKVDGDKQQAKLDQIKQTVMELEIIVKSKHNRRIP